MRLKSWKEIPIGGLILDAGNAHDYKTGDWRSKRPVIDKGKCTSCLICWIYCPDSSVIIKDGKFDHFDLDHCKGCGICAKECPVKCVEMKNEGEFEHE